MEKICQKKKLDKIKAMLIVANGADKIAEVFAKKFNIPIEIIRADWSIGKQAGVIRNTEIVKKSDFIIAFWDGISKGSKDSITKAKKLNKKLFIFETK